MTTTWKERFGGAALVTGASSGIGTAFARALAARGMDLVLVARRGDRLDSLARELEAAHGIRAISVVADLTRPDAAEHVRREVDAKRVNVGLLVNNAGAGVPGPFVEQDPARIAGMVDLNCRAPAALARAFADGMVARGRGGIIFVSSAAAYQPSPLLAAYGATKAFDLSLAEALWAELGPKGIDVLALSPGYTETEFQEVSGAELKSPGGVATPVEVVGTALDALGRQPSVVHGFRNALMTFGVRLLPRAFVASMGLRYMRGAMKPGIVERPGPAVARSALTGSGRFQRAVTRMIVAFLSVAVIDLFVGSILAHKLRLWFPGWLDAQWATRSDGWVTYSQSYLAGVFFIPFLAAEAMREFMPRTAAIERRAVLAATVAVLGFIAWWKGGLMVEYHKEAEALGWLVLTAVTWGLLRLGEELPGLTSRWTPRRLAAGVAGGVATFFLVMAVADPVLQVAVQHLGWSSGLIVEVGFFVPAGVILAFVAMRLRGVRATPRSEAGPAVQEARR